MQRIALSFAQTELKQLIDAAMRGETVLIVSDDQQAVQLVPVTSGKRRRKAGSVVGLIKFADDFDASLPDFDDYR
jgi:antitoxin (DNA-binding transcriptional repressor) of toxin-antitoxin stability system